jgi:hypothetical protein
LGHSELYNSLAEEDNAGLEEEPTCEAKESDKKKKAIAATTRILFELTQFNKHTGKVVLDKRSNSTDLVKVAPISSSLSIVLNKIHQSFVLVDPHLPDMPIVHASNLFLQLTGLILIHGLSQFHVSDSMISTFPFSSIFFYEFQSIQYPGLVTLAKIS